MDIIYIDQITTYLACNVRPILHIYSFSESDWWNIPISALWRERFATNWNYGEWAIVILFSLILLKAWAEPSLIFFANIS